MVVTNVNIPTATGRASWFVRFWFHIGGGHTKLHELSVWSVKKEPTPVINEEEQEIDELIQFQYKSKKTRFKRLTMEAKLPLLLFLIQIR